MPTHRTFHLHVFRTVLDCRPQTQHCAVFLYVPLWKDHYRLQPSPKTMPYQLWHYLIWTSEGKLNCVFFAMQSSLHGQGWSRAVRIIFIYNHPLPSFICQLVRNRPLRKCPRAMNTHQMFPLILPVRASLLTLTKASCSKFPMGKTPSSCVSLDLVDVGSDRD